MQQIKMLVIFASCLVLKASIVAGAEMEKSGTENINTVMAVGGNVIANPDYAEPDPYALDWKKIALYASNEETQAASSTKTDAAPAAVIASPPPATTTVVQVPAPVQNNNVSLNVQGNDTRANKEESSSSISARVQENPTSAPLRAAITPMAGMTNYYGAWGDHVRNSYTFGLGIEIALNSVISIEAEGGYSKSDVGYLYYHHDFNQYSAGGNAKLYLSRSVIQPWIGFGAMGLYYENMSHGPSFPYSTYSQWVGAVQPIAGLDVELIKGMAFGVRGAYVIPTFNKPRTLDNGSYSFPYYEEAGLMNTSFYKVMADVKVMF